MAPALLTASTITKSAATRGRMLQLISRANRMVFDRLRIAIMSVTAVDARNVGRPRFISSADAVSNTIATAAIPKRLIFPISERPASDVEPSHGAEISAWQYQRRIE